MRRISLKQETSKAARIGGACITTYLVSYITRNVLSVSAPQMVEEAFFTKEYTGLLSSVCFIFYAVGQLINGFIGDRVRPKYMVSAGLLISGLTALTVPLVQSRTAHFVCFAVMGYSLSMLRGPMTKIISENTAPGPARILCTLLNMTCYAGPLIASFLSMLLDWRMVFTVTGILSLTAAAAAFFLIQRLERKAIVRFIPDQSPGIRGLLGVFAVKDFLFFLAIAAISEVAGTSITFWVPTYSTEYLSLSRDGAALVYSLVSLTGIFVPFATLFFYEKVLKSGRKLACWMFALATALFVLTRLISSPVINIVLLILGGFAAKCAGSITWSIYVPGLGGCGKVSAANGVMDAAGYAAASAANAVFSGVVGLAGWTGLIDLWCVIMAAGAAVAAVKIFRTRREAD